MDPEFWLQRWQRWQIGFHQFEINAHLQAFWPGLNLPQGSSIFVPLCGKSRDMLWLRASGHRVLGVEISPVAVQEFFSENGLSPRTEATPGFACYEIDGLRLCQGDFFDIGPGNLVGCVGVYDRASLVALPPAMRERYARHLHSLLPAQTEILLVTMEYPEGEMQGPPFSVHEQEVRALYDNHYRVERLFDMDMLSENPQLQSKGLTRLQEKVYRLTSMTLN